MAAKGTSMGAKNPVPSSYNGSGGGMTEDSDTPAELAHDKKRGITELSEGDAGAPAGKTMRKAKASNSMGGY